MPTPFRRCRGFGTRQLFRPPRSGNTPCNAGLRAASYRAEPCRGPPRRRSSARRTYASWGSRRTRRCGRRDRSREHQDVQKLSTGNWTDARRAAHARLVRVARAPPGERSTREEQRPAPADGRSGRYSSLPRLRAGRRDPAFRASSTIALAAAACSLRVARSVLAADRSRR